MQRAAFSFLAIAALSCAACGSSSSSDSDQNPEDTARSEQLRALADAYVSTSIESDDPGLAYFVIGPRGVLAEGAYGLANLEEDLPITPETPFELGSVSKQFTAMAVMILVEDEELSIEDPIANELPEAPSEWSGITIEQLLVHTSGIPNLEEVPGPERANWTNDDILDWAVTQPLRATPGEEFNYTNTGYALLALIVERVSEQPFETFAKERIFDPLGMIDSAVDPVWPPDIPERAVSYLLDVSIEVSGGGTGWAAQHSTIEDMKRWDAELRNPTLVSAGTLAEIYTAHVSAPTGEEQDPPNYAACGYGYGWDICDQEGLPPEVSHTGEYSTFHSWYRRFPDDGLSVLVLTNGSNSSGNVFWGYVLADELAKAYFTELP